MSIDINFNSIRDSNKTLKKNYFNDNSNNTINLNKCLDSNVNNNITSNIQISNTIMLERNILDIKYKDITNNRYLEDIKSYLENFSSNLNFKQCDNCNVTNKETTNSAVLFENNRWMFCRDLDIDLSLKEDIRDRLFKILKKMQCKKKEYINNNALTAIKYSTFGIYKAWLLPDSLFLFIWDLIILFCVFINMILYSLHITFGIHALNQYIIILFEIFFIVDIVLNFNLAYYRKNKLITDKTMIVINYIKFWFWIDILACFPSDLLEFLAFRNNFSKIALIKNNNTFKYFIYIKISLVFKAFKLLNRFNVLGQDFIDNIVMSASSMKIVVVVLILKYVLMITIIAHFGTCLIYLFSYSETNKNNFVNIYRINDMSTIEKYSIFMYYFIQTISTTGYGNYVAQNNTERIMVLFNLIMFGGIFSSLVGSLTVILQNRFYFDSSERRRMSSYLKMIKYMPQTTQEKVKIELMTKLRVKENKIATEEELPEELNTDVYKLMVLYLNYEIVINFPIFNKNEIFSVYLANELEKRIFVFDEVVFIEDHLSSKIYCLVYGKLKIFSKKRKNFKYFIDKKNSVVGSLEFVTNKNYWLTSCKAYKQSQMAYITYYSINKVADELLLINEDSYNDFISMLNEYRTKINEENRYDLINLRCNFCKSSNHLSLNCENIINKY